MLVGILSSEEVDNTAAGHHERFELVLSQSLVVQLTAGYWPERDWIRPYLRFYINSDISGPCHSSGSRFMETRSTDCATSEDARREAGHALYEVQKGHDPSDWKPMPTIGAGVREIRIRDTGGAA